MRLIDSNVEYVPVHGYDLDSIYADIARAGRICYASDKTTDNDKFVEECIKKGHGRPLEFGTVYLTLYGFGYQHIIDKYIKNAFSKVKLHNGVTYITTNYRVLVENEWLDDMKYMTEPSEHHEKRYTLHWTVSRATADSFRTHTSLSSLMQSTRYCNYSRDKFGGQLTIIRPHWISMDFGEYDFEYLANAKSLGIGPLNFEYLTQMLMTECRYNLLTQQYNLKAEDARSVLPLDIKTEFIQCGFLDDWKHFFDLRVRNTTGKAHPDANDVASRAELILKEQGIL